MTEHGDEKAEKLAQSQETSEGLSQVDLIQGLSLPHWKNLYLQIIDAGENPTENQPLSIRHKNILKVIWNHYKKQKQNYDKSRLKEG